MQGSKKALLYIRSSLRSTTSIVASQTAIVASDVAFATLQ